MAGIYKRGTTWWGRATRKGVERRRSLETGNRATAEKRLKLWIADLEATEWGGKQRRTYSEAVEKFILEHLPTLKPSAAKRYGVSIMKLTEQFHGLALDKIGTAELAAFETKRRTEGVTPSTIRRDFACLSSILSMAEEWEWLEDSKNPVPAYLKRRKRRGLKEAAPGTRYLSDTEEARLLKVATGTLRDAIILAIDTGLRKEELLSLTWDRVDMDRKFITTGTKTKSGRSRLVPLPDRACGVLAQIQAQQEALAPKLLARNPEVKDPFVYVLSHQNGKRFVDFLKVFKAAATDALVYGVNWHDLRRTAGCRWLQDQGYSMEEVSMFLGHSSVTLTEKTYAFLDAEKSATRRTKTGTEQVDFSE